MKALTPQLARPMSDARRGLHAAEVSLLISIELPSIPPLTTLLPFRSSRFNTLRFYLPYEPPHHPADAIRHPELGLVWDVV